MQTAPLEFLALVACEIDRYQFFPDQVMTEKTFSINLPRSTVLPYDITDRLRAAVQDEETGNPTGFLIYENKMTMPYVSATFDLQKDSVIDIMSKTPRIKVRSVFLSMLGIAGLP